MENRKNRVVLANNDSWAGCTSVESIDFDDYVSWEQTGENEDEEEKEKVNLGEDFNGGKDKRNK